MGLIKSNCKIILGSSSKVRSEIMRNANLEFEVRNPDFDEEIFKNNNPQLKIQDLVTELAKNKALSIASSNNDELIIGCDQICEVEGKRIDKSKDKFDAISQLKLMSDKTHYQNNSVIIAKNGKIIFEHFTKVELKMHNLTESQIISYVDADNPIGCAGSYKYESLGKILFDKVDGDHFSILGMNIQQVMSFMFRNNYIKI